MTDSDVDFSRLVTLLAHPTVVSQSQTWRIEKHTMFNVVKKFWEAESTHFNTYWQNLPEEQQLAIVMTSLESEPEVCSIIN